MYIHVYIHARCSENDAPALMHFCELQALLILPMSELGSTVPRKMGLNWMQTGQGACQRFVQARVIR